MDNQEIIEEFLIESYENLDQLDRDLVALEQDPTSEPTLSSIFRTIHTIKGTCGFLGFSRLESVAHAGESLLGKLRDGKLQLRPETTSGLLSLVDAVRQMVANIERAGEDGEEDYTELVRNLVRLQEAEMTGDTDPATNDHKERLDSSSDSTARQSDEQHPADQEDDGATPKKGVAENTIRVDVDLLDKLTDRVGELVLARNQILQSMGTSSDSALLSTSHRLNLITTELQEGVMKTRLQPIKHVWDKFPRVARDLAVRCGKQVRIVMEGKETELDKTIIEAIKDPLTHLIRNSVDHGIETPEVRRSSGKPAEGRLLLRAFHGGGLVNIEVTDDGAGLNLERIRRTAVERGLISQDQALRMNDREISQLIFAAGFSTATEVTSVSGRGVGMDVVKTNIEKIGGTIDVQSQPGRGITIKIKIPLTLAIVPALIVGCAADRFAIPQASLLELVRLEGDQARKGIERIHAAAVYRLRGRLLPIVYLRDELGLEGPSPAAGDGADCDEVVNIVVLQADDRQFGLVIDAVQDTKEIVVKPLGKQLKGIGVYAGATIMGDGKVALILDVLGMAQRAHVVAEVRERSLVDRTTQSAEKDKDRRTLLILAVGNRRLALHLSLVSRLEGIPWENLETADDKQVVQYRGRIMPLLHLGRLLGIPTEENREQPLQVVVHSERGRSVGFIVDRIIDIVEATVEVTRPAQHDDLLVSAVIERRVTDLIDVPALVRRADPTFFEYSDEQVAIR